MSLFLLVKGCSAHAFLGSLFQKAFGKIQAWIGKGKLHSAATVISQYKELSFHCYPYCVFSFSFSTKLKQAWSWSTRHSRQKHSCLNNLINSDRKVKTVAVTQACSVFICFFCDDPLKLWYFILPGTLVVVYNLKLMDNGEPELDVSVGWPASVAKYESTLLRIIKL